MAFGTGTIEFNKENFLPGAALDFTAGNRKGKLGAEKSRAEMGGGVLIDAVMGKTADLGADEIEKFGNG